MAKKIATVATKGGAGKTTLTANLGAALADLGQRVLLIDTDVQQSLSKFYELSFQAEYGLIEMIKSASATDCISSTVIEGLDIVLNNDPKNTLKHWIDEAPSTHIHYLVPILKSLDALYDVILIDTIGTKQLGETQEMAIRASDLCLCPLTPEWLAARELPNTIDLLKKLEPPAGVHIGQAIPPLAVILWKTRHTNVSRDIVSYVTDEEGPLFTEYYRQANGKFSVLNTKIPETESYIKASEFGIPIHRFEPKRIGPTPSGADSMYQLTTELFTHLTGSTFKDIKG